MNKSVIKIVDKMIDSQIIGVADRELYEFGIQQGTTLLLNVLTTIGIGLLMGMFWESLIFLILYTPIRVYAGGFHAQTQIRCYFLSVFIVLASLTLIRAIQNASVSGIIIMAAAGGVIWKKAPVENKVRWCMEKKPDMC